MPQAAGNKKRLVRELIASKRMSAWPFQNHHASMSGKDSFPQIRQVGSCVQQKDAPSSFVAGSASQPNPPKRVRRLGEDRDQCLPLSDIKSLQKHEQLSLEVHHLQRLQSPQIKRTFVLKAIASHSDDQGQGGGEGQLKSSVNSPVDSDEAYNTDGMVDVINVLPHFQFPMASSATDSCIAPKKMKMGKVISSHPRRTSRVI